MLLKLTVSILIAATLLFFSVRELNWDSIGKAMVISDLPMLMLSLFIILMLPILRSWRLKLMLDSVVKIPFNTLFSINAVGYLFIMILPLRIGELIIPMLIRNKFNASLSAVLSVVFIERIIDLIVLLLILFATISIGFLPPWMLKVASAFLAFMIFVVIALLIFHKKSDLIVRFFAPLIKRLPAFVQEKQKIFIAGFNDGIKTVANPKNLIYVSLLSFVVWMLSAASVFCLLQAFNLPLKFLGALTLMLINVLGISVPAGPGMMGNFQYSCILALSLFGVDKNTAFDFSMGYYMVAVGSTVLIGLFCLPLVKVSFKELKSIILKK